MKTWITRLCAWVIFSSGAHAANIPVGWGGNSDGVLGNGTTSSSASPVETDVTGALLGKDIVSVIGGANANHMLAITSDGLAYAWGRNDDGQLGVGFTSTHETLPLQVDHSGELLGKKIIKAAAGSSHTVVLTDDGKLFAWGENSFGQLGNGSRTDSLTPTAVDMTGVISGKTITSLAVGQGHTLVLDSNGIAYGWGKNSVGQLGSGSTGSAALPVQVSTSGVLASKVIASISAGEFHSFAVTSDGTAVAWGSNLLGQLGDGTTTNRTTPVLVDSSGVLASKTIVAVSTGRFHSVALDSDGKVYSWGGLVGYELGRGLGPNSIIPVEVDTTGVLSGKTVKEIATNEFNSYVLTTDGELFSWGTNSYGQCGSGVTGSSEDSPVSVLMSGVLAGKSVSSLTATLDCAMVLAAPSAVSVLSANRHSYAANFGWTNWRWSTSSSSTPVVESTLLRGKLYCANIGWIDLGDGTPTDFIRYSQSGADTGVNHDGAGNLSGYAYGASIGWVTFDPTISDAPRIHLTTGAMSGRVYSANCGWIQLGGLKARIIAGRDHDGPLGIGDGIEDAWELEYGNLAGYANGDTLLGASALADFDQDGVSDLNEYLADTNPFVVNDKLEITHFNYQPQTGAVDLDWTGSQRRAYTVYCSSDLQTWTQVIQPLTGGSASFSLSGPSKPNLFFRIGAELPLK